MVAARLSLWSSVFSFCAVYADENSLVVRSGGHSTLATTSVMSSCCFSKPAISGPARPRCGRWLRESASAPCQRAPALGRSRLPMLFCAGPNARKSKRRLHANRMVPRHQARHGGCVAQYFPSTAISARLAVDLIVPITRSSLSRSACQSYDESEHRK